MTSHSNEEEFWDHKHRGYATKTFITHPNWLATTLCDNLSAPANVLDLGCGQGQDTLYFSDHGMQVTSVDFSTFALAQFRQAATERGIRQLRHDLSVVPYPFDSEEFDAVYAHLSLHYFDATTTHAVFAEIARVLRPGGQLWALFNSDHDPEASDPSFRVLENRFLELAPGNRKRYFTASELSDLLGADFEVYVARYGHGTAKSKADEYVELVASKKRR